MRFLNSINGYDICAYSKAECEEYGYDWPTFGAFYVEYSKRRIPKCREFLTGSYSSLIDLCVSAEYLNVFREDNFVKKLFEKIKRRRLLKRAKELKRSESFLIHWVKVQEFIDNPPRSGRQCLVSEMLEEALKKSEDQE